MTNFAFSVLSFIQLLVLDRPKVGLVVIQPWCHFKITKFITCLIAIDPFILVATKTSVINIWDYVYIFHSHWFSHILMYRYSHAKYLGCFYLPISAINTIIIYILKNKLTLYSKLNYTAKVRHLTLNVDWN